MGLIAALEKEGFDHATATTISEMADGQSIPEAGELLRGILGTANASVLKYIDERQQRDRQNARASKKAVSVKSDRAKPSQQFSAQQKADSVKDLESAVKRLSINSPDRRPCDCLGSKHGLLEVAPNCLVCGRIVCNKEGIGPCLFCGKPLLPSSQIKDIVRILTHQRDGIVSTMSKRALHAAGIDPASKPDVNSLFTSNEEAERNLERLLGYQENDAVRTRIIDQVGDVDIPAGGANQWATPEEQAEQLRLQQRKLRRLEEERKARAGHGKRVVSIDIRGNKVYQSVVDASIDSDEDLEDEPAKAMLDKTAPKSEPKVSSYFSPKEYSLEGAAKYPDKNTVSVQSEAGSEEALQLPDELSIVYNESEALQY